MSQRALFLGGAGDAYHARNRELDPARLAACDPVLAGARQLGLAPGSALEIGSGDGWRLAALRAERPGCECVGIDPSRAALCEGAQRHPGVGLVRATAERLPFASGRFDLVILGFCLYLVDREDLFAAAAEVDRVLRGEGHVAIFDFEPDAPHRRAFAHARGAYSYKMDHAAMFTWNPAYRRVAHQTLTHPGGDPSNPDDRLGVCFLRRDGLAAWRER